MPKPKLLIQTPKQKQLQVRKRQLTDFRRFVRLVGEGSIVHEYIGMNAFEFRNYIEGQWLPGMNWSNYGSFWCIDHIVALKYFDVFSRKDMLLCWNYNNLKPSLLGDNHAKGYCVEVSEKILKGLPKNAIVYLLLKKIDSYKNMFHVYY